MRLSRRFAVTGLLLASCLTPGSVVLADEACRPDGLYVTPGTNPPHCVAYDTAGREKMAISRRIIGYFPSWRTGDNGQPAYLVKDIPWTKITHINYAFG